MYSRSGSAGPSPPEEPEELQAADCLRKLASRRTGAIVGAFPPLTPLLQPSLLCVVPYPAAQYRLFEVSWKQGQLSCVKRIFFQIIFGSALAEAGTRAAILSFQNLQGPLRCLRLHQVPWECCSVLKFLGFTSGFFGAVSSAASVKTLRLVSGFFGSTGPLQSSSSAPSLPPTSLCPCARCSPCQGPQVCLLLLQVPAPAAAPVKVIKFASGSFKSRACCSHPLRPGDHRRWLLDHQGFPGLYRYRRLALC